MAVHDLSLYLKSDRSSFNLLVHVVSEAELSPKDIVARNTIISIIMIIDTKVTYRDQERNFCCRILFTVLLIQASFYHMAQEARRKSKILDRKRCTFFDAMIGVTGHRLKSVLPLNAAACFVVAAYEMMKKKDIIIIILLLLLDEDIIGVGCWRLHRSASQLWDEWEEG